MAINSASTLFDKLWSDHTVCELDSGETLLYIDRVFLHERTGSIALQSLHSAGYKVRDARRVFCTMDHIVDTFPGRGDKTLMPSGSDFILATRSETRAANIRLFDVNDEDQGIVHVISPELGLVLPGLTQVCPDSHTCTLGGIGALAWGIGSSEAEHALATGTLRVRKPKNMRVIVDGELASGVTAKDLVLHLIARFGSNGGAGYAVEFCGSAIRRLSVEARFTLCNMAVEFSAFTAIIAPDETVEDYVAGRDFAPKGEHWHDACRYWRTLRSDEDAVFDRELRVDANLIRPMVTWGTSPEQVAGLHECTPDPETFAEIHRREAAQRALEYQGLKPGQVIADIAVNAAFIGSCTNSRISDLRAAAAVVQGRHIAPGVRGVVVPGSRRVKREAEKEGLDRIFTAAGFEWRDSGCSMCFYAGGETFGAHQRVISSTNRNFEGRQGPNTRTHLASPATVAASAIAGYITSAESLANSESLIA
ncbi:3-isopropylmalate dehydratase large subunit [Microbulbifer hydrolyticus]|uniref:3-isopropylmalate dehydratase n=1 Tax=Microbulbifer hydrolyticus TaxID=48074 RepID=A0A6P1TC99_9GAMM|nr:3-isopropylmalate dehydratase large subunit [Microbulbifer hydrolyticus]MBB5210127.1 3-isopropylmalate/(R)-2-methylmalate dehydratase large subunit [Microbulbifer hydrolyticus]QHQ39355.1 3-isopropylmalate dehydratase large subunit [Microbulbifer hydrolyticus]